jgi:hypothetical protein
MQSGWVALDAKALRLPKDTSLVNYSAGQTRDVSRDFVFCKGKKFAHIRVEDPFVTKSEWNYKQLKRFIETLLPMMSNAPSKMTVRTKYEEDPAQKLMLQDLEKWLKAKGSTLAFELVPTFGPGKKDFHDRRILFFPEEASPKKRVAVLLTGGVDRYLESKFECSLVIHSS